MRSARRFQIAFLLSSFAVALPSAVAQVVAATVPAGTQPYGVAVNSAANKAYVTNFSDNTITVIDGITNTTVTVNVGVTPYAVAVNPVTNKIYVANQCGNDPTCASNGTVTIVDGNTDSTTTLNVGAYPDAVAVNSVTNQIYVANSGDNTVTVIDGATNKTTTVGVGNSPNAMAVNSVTNQIYVTNSIDDTVSVIDGAANDVIATVNVGVNPYAVAVNSTTNQIYVVNNCGNDDNCDPSSPGTVTDIDGASNTNSATVNVGVNPIGIAVNLTTNQIYVVNNCGDGGDCSRAGTVTVIDGVTDNTVSVAVGIHPVSVAVDAVTNKIYVPNYCGNSRLCQSAGTVSVINGADNSIVPVAAGDGPQTLAVNAATDRIYVANYFDNTVSVIAGDTALQLVAVPPCRLVDTRKTGGPIQGGAFRSFPVPQEGGCNVPATAAAYALNVTLVPDQGSPVAYLTLWPASERRPLVSTMNSLDGRIKANAAVVPAGVSGEVSVYVTDTTDVVLDIDGYFALTSSSTLAFYPLTPCRVLDTRNMNGALGGPFLSGGQERDFPVLESNCGIPNTAQAYSMNFTVVPVEGQPLGYLTVWPQGSQRPVVSTLNNLTATIVANAAIVPAGTGGGIATYPDQNTQLVADIDGYFAPAGQKGLSLYPSVSCRVLDTRNVGSGQPFSGELTVDVVNSICVPPLQAQAYVFNATVVPKGPLGYLTLWPDGESQPLASTLNAVDGAITSNMAIVPTKDGSVDAYASGITQLILDISSYFAP